MKETMNRMIRNILTLLLLFSATMVCHAQNADKLFMQGQNLQQKMSISSQNAAIKKFQAAKVMYNTSDKKQMCDNQISICNRNISYIRRSRKAAEKEPEVEETTRFSLSQEEINFDGNNEGVFNVKIEAPKDWTHSVPEGLNGADNFVTVTRKDASSIDISVNRNPMTISRDQIVNVDCGDERKAISVHQSGKPVTLSTETNLLEFNLKSGNKTIELYTNSDSIIASNNNLTWYVESKPDWVNISVKVKKKQGILGKFKSAIENAVSGTAEAATDEDVKISNVVVSVKAVPRSLPEYNTGRKGEIVFASQDKRYSVMVEQFK